MIKLEGQQNLLLAISTKLKKKMRVYAVGGTAMMLSGFKDATKDIDLVFENEGDRTDFKNAAEELGYKKTDTCLVYGTRDNQPIMLTLGDERFDLFVNTVVDFIFSDDMRKRATERIYQYGNNLILNIANPTDIILMKCATDRSKDEDDCIKIIQVTNVDWEMIINEAQLQLKLGCERAILDLGDFLEKLKKVLKEKIPQEVLDKLYDMLSKQIKDKSKKK